jgi:hypothetical protein
MCLEYPATKKLQLFDGRFKYHIGSVLNGILLICLLIGLARFLAFDKIQNFEVMKYTK